MCLSPINLDGMSVPCGKCAQCRLKRRNSHYQALCDIASRYKNVYFWTLTYNDEHVHKTDSGNLTLCREDIKKWFKICRKLYQYHFPGETLDFKYWFVGEYGSQTGRPHYHGLTFGLTSKQIAFFRHKWKHGFFYTTQLSTLCDQEKVIGYVLKYILKDYFDKKYLEDVEKPRVMQSINLCELKPEELAWYTGADLGITQDDVPDYETCLRISDRRFRYIGKYKYRLSERYARKYFKRPTVHVDYWTGEVKKSFINTPLQDAIASALQIKHVADYNAELRQLEDAIESGVSRFEAYNGFAAKTICHSEEDCKAADRKLQQIVKRDKF